MSEYWLSLLFFCAGLLLLHGLGIRVEILLPDWLSPLLDLADLLLLDGLELDFELPLSNWLLSPHD